MSAGEAARQVGERWAYSVEALRVVHVPVRGVLLWAGSASSPRFQHVDGGGDSGRGGGVAGVAVREGRVLHPWGDRGGAAGAVRVNCTGRDFGKQIEGHLCSDIKSTEIYRKLWKVTGSRKIRVC